MKNETIPKISWTEGHSKSKESVSFKQKDRDPFSVIDLKKTRKKRDARKYFKRQKRSRKSYILQKL